MQRYSGGARLCDRGLRRGTGAGKNGFSPGSRIHQYPEGIGTDHAQRAGSKNRTAVRAKDRFYGRDGQHGQVHEGL